MQANDKSIRFHELLEIKLNDTLTKEFSLEGLTPALMKSIRSAIQEQIRDVFSKSSHTLTPNAITWLGDQYFKSIKLNSNQLMADLVIINEYKLSELEFSDIKLLYNLYRDTKMGPELIDEMRTRNAS